MHFSCSSVTFRVPHIVRKCISSWWIMLTYLINYLIIPFISLFIVFRPGPWHRVNCSARLER